jgi:hypothetical protein
MKQTKRTKIDIDNSTFRVVNFNTFVSVIDRTNREKIS